MATYNSKQDPNHPHAHGINWQLHLIPGPHNSSHFREWRIVGFVGQDLGRITITQNGKLMIMGV